MISPLLWISNMAPRGRFELPTLRLTAECSAVELTGNVAFSSNYAANYIPMPRWLSRHFPSHLSFFSRIASNLLLRVNQSIAYGCIIIFRLSLFSGTYGYTYQVLI